MANYKCLVLDHDDTVVQSAETVNYPSYLEALSVLRPQVKLSFREFTLGLFRKDFAGFCTEAFGYTPRELEWHFAQWKQYVRTHIPPVYPGIPALLRRFHRDGGLICMASHSGEENICRDFRTHIGFLPDRIYSSDLPEEKRKPHPFPLEDILANENLRPEELLVVDDMAGGLRMAQSCGVPFACAGWSHRFPEVADFMKSRSRYYLTSVDELEALIWG